MTCVLQSGSGLDNFEFVHQAWEENAQLTLVFAGIPAGIIVTNANGLITYVNETAKVMLKWKNPLLYTNIFTKIVTIADSRVGRPIEDPYEKIMKMKAVWWLPKHAALISLDKAKVFVAGNLSPICNNEGVVTGMIAVLFPIAETNCL